MPATSPSPTQDRSQWLWWVAVACAVASAGWFAWAAMQRVGYPFELEWMEGALGDHAWRIAHGLPLYCAPGPEHVPFLYAPLLFWLGGALIACGVDEIVALRLVAIACTVGSALLIGHWVRRETGRLLPGLAATGLFFAGYGWLAWWYDLARNDTLFVFCCLATGYQLRLGGARRWLWAALLATAALLAKQSALMWLPAVFVGALCLDWRMALRFGAASAVAMAIAVGALHLASDGWSTFYLFEMPRHHGWVGENKLGFWTRDLVPMLPLLALGLAGFVASCRAGTARTGLFLAAFGSGALLTSWFSRLHVGGFDNVLMYGFAGACVLGPIAAAGGRGAGRIVRVLAVLAQFAWLGHAAWQRSVATLLPTPAHRQAHEELRAFVAAQPGPVWIPGHGAIGTRAGKGTGAHGQAIFDLLQLLPRNELGIDLSALHDRTRLAQLSPRAQQALASLVDATDAALRERRFAAIVLEHGTHMFDQVFAAGLCGDDGRLGTADDTYVRSPTSPVTQPAAIAPLLGYPVHSPWVLLPRR